MMTEGRAAGAGVGREIASRLTGNVPCHEHGGGNEGVYTFTQNPSNRTLKMGIFYCMKISLNKVLKQKLKKNNTSKAKGCPCSISLGH